MLSLLNGRTQKMLLGQWDDCTDDKFHTLKQSKPNEMLLHDSLFPPRPLYHVKKAVVDVLMHFPYVYMFLYQKDSEACGLCPNVASQLFCC